MLQLRGENEQFSSLPSLRILDHPRLSIITTDRPDSSQVLFIVLSLFHNLEVSPIRSLLIYMFMLFRKMFGKMVSV